MKNPKVSIITVTYNVVNTIEQTIQSVLGQTYKNVEYIVVDGMSTDGTWEKIIKYNEKISCSIHENDKGLYDAMNKGIECATGEIIGIINGDDWYEQNAVETVVQAFEKVDVDIIYGDMNVFDSERNTVRIGKRDIENIWVDMIAHPTVFVKAETYKKYSKFDLKYSIVADYEMILRFYTNGVRFMCLDSVLANFRKGGLTTQKRLESAKEVKMISLTYINKCPEPDKFLKLIYKKYNNTLLDIIYNQDDDVFSNLLRAEMVGEKLCIFGAGKLGLKFINKLNRCRIKCLFVVDNDIRKQGTYLEGIKIKAFDILRTWQGNVLIATAEYREVYDQLIQDGSENLNLIALSKLCKE